MIVSLIFSLILSLIAKCMDTVMSDLLQALDMNMGAFTNTFPVVIEFYEILQAVAMGIVLGVGLFQLVRFFGGRLEEMRESPVQLLVNMAIAVVFIYFGNYLLSWLIDLFNLPYQMMVDKVGTVRFSEMIEYVHMEDGNILDLIFELFSPARVAVEVIIWTVCLFLIIYHTCKILLEVVERYIVLCVLMYTSPLAWATLASNATRPIFKKWVSMFVSACLMILLSAWSLVMMFSTLKYAAESIVMTTLFFVALSKVAQRMDNILQTLGLNPVITGAGLFEDIMVGVGAAAPLVKKATRELSGIKLGGFPLHRGNEMPGSGVGPRGPGGPNLPGGKGNSGNLPGGPNNSDGKSNSPGGKGNESKNNPGGPGSRSNGPGKPYVPGGQGNGDQNHPVGPGSNNTPGQQGSGNSNHPGGPGHAEGSAEGSKMEGSQSGRGSGDPTVTPDTDSADTAEVVTDTATAATIGPDDASDHSTAMTDDAADHGAESQDAPAPVPAGTDRLSADESGAPSTSTEVSGADATSQNTAPIVEGEPQGAAPHPVTAQSNTPAQPNESTNVNSTRMVSEASNPAQPVVSERTQKESERRESSSTERVVTGTTQAAPTAPQASTPKPQGERRVRTRSRGKKNGSAPLTDDRNQPKK